MNVIGFHCSFNSKTHDPNVALLQQGRLTYAAEEERFLRYKTASGRFPEYAFENCLDYANLSIHDVDLVAFDGITSKTLVRKIERKILDLYGYCPQLVAVHHADSHCYGAYYSSGFSDCLVISLDGNGDCVSGRI